MKLKNVFWTKSIFTKALVQDFPEKLIVLISSLDPSVTPHKKSES